MAASLGSSKVGVPENSKWVEGRDGVVDPYIDIIEICNPLWTSASGNPYEVSKAIQQGRLLSGRYRTEYNVTNAM